MKVSSRREAIYRAVMSGIEDVASLCLQFSMSEATVRRDLRALSEEGRLVRTYGGATAPVRAHEPEASLETRRTLQRAQKVAIARAALAHIAPGETIYLDGGTTAEALARLLGGVPSVQVVTNSLLAGAVLASLRVPVTLVGGELRASSMSLLGPLAEASLQRLSVHKAFLSADGVVAGRGLCEASGAQSWLKQCAMRQAAEVFVLADADKLGRAAQTHWTLMQQPWHLITDWEAKPEQLAPFRERHDVTVELAPPHSATLA